MLVRGRWQGGRQWIGRDRKGRRPREVDARAGHGGGGSGSGSVRLRGGGRAVARLVMPGPDLGLSGAGVKSGGESSAGQKTVAGACAATRAKKELVARCRLSVAG